MTTPMTIEQEQLLFKQGGREAIEYFYKTYYVYVFAIVNYILKNVADAQEITNDVFVSFWIISKKTNIETTFRAYLGMAARYKALTFIKKLNKQRKGLHGYIPEKYDDRYDLLTDEELITELYKSIETLNPKCRRSLEMVYFGKLKHQRVADMTNRSINTIKKQVYDALEELRNKLV